jgi:hypothetical protein
MGHVPSLGVEELKVLVVLFMLPSICVWIAMARGLDHKHVSSAIVRGLAWPFATLVIGASLSKIFRFDLEFVAHLAFVLSAVLPLGVPAGVIMHRVVNAQHATSRN